jgi:hypothetical protein
MPLAAPARPRKIDAGDDFIGNARHRIEVDAEGLAAHQHFTGDFKKNSLVADFAHGF